MGSKPSFHPLAQKQRNSKQRLKGKLRARSRRTSIVKIDSESLLWATQAGKDL
jgi:hypothetical protein